MVTRVPLSQGLVALVDDEDANAVLSIGKWSAWVSEGYTYACRAVAGRDGRQTSIKLHTFLTGWPLVDHINGDGLDCRRGNLRPATHADNMRNRRLLGRNNTSGYKGVSWARDRNRWCARIQYEGRGKHLGYYTDPIEAARAYDAAALELFGQYARVNFPEGRP